MFFIFHLQHFVKQSSVMHESLPKILCREWRACGGSFSSGQNDSLSQPAMFYMTWICSGDVLQTLLMVLERISPSRHDIRHKIISLPDSAKRIIDEPRLTRTPLFAEFVAI
jgi:hypothetical protein